MKETISSRIIIKEGNPHEIENSQLFYFYAIQEWSEDIHSLHLHRLGQSKTQPAALARRTGMIRPDEVSLKHQIDTLHTSSIQQNTISTHHVINTSKSNVNCSDQKKSSSNQSLTQISNIKKQQKHSHLHHQ